MRFTERGGAEGVEGYGLWRVSPPSRLEGLGSVVSSLGGGALTANAFQRFLSITECFDEKKMRYFCLICGNR